MSFGYTIELTRFGQCICYWFESPDPKPFILFLLFRGKNSGFFPHSITLWTVPPKETITVWLHTKWHHALVAPKCWFLYFVTRHIWHKEQYFLSAVDLEPGWNSVAIATGQWSTLTEDRGGRPTFECEVVLQSKIAKKYSWIKWPRILKLWKILVFMRGCRH